MLPRLLVGFLPREFLMRTQWAGLLLVGVWTACSGSGASGVKKPSGDSSKAVAQALMRSATLKDGSTKAGGLPKATAEAVLLMPLMADPLEPGESSIMPI